MEFLVCPYFINDDQIVIIAGPHTNVRCTTCMLLVKKMLLQEGKDFKQDDVRALARKAMYFCNTCKFHGRDVRFCEECLQANAWDHGSWALRGGAMENFKPKELEKRPRKPKEDKEHQEKE